MSPYEERIIDIKFSQKISGSVSMSIEEGAFYVLTNIAKMSKLSINCLFFNFSFCKLLHCISRFDICNCMYFHQSCSPGGMYFWSSGLLPSSWLRL